MKLYDLQRKIQLYLPEVLLLIGDTAHEDSYISSYLSLGIDI